MKQDKNCHGSMRKKLIAIVGSADESRSYDPPLRDAAGAHAAAERLGEALARAGHSIMVYSANSGFIERDVVRGFIASGKARAKSVVVLFPSGAGETSAFPERANHEEIFDVRQDNSPDWEIAFYRSLGQADGVALLGGGPSTFITGLLALTYQIPLLALAVHGGNAEKVWRSLIAGDLLTEEQIHCMAEPGRPEVVKRWLDSLEAQFDAKRRDRRRHLNTWPSLVALILLISWVSTLPIGFLVMPVDSAPALSVNNWRHVLFTFLVFTAPLLSGASGATIRTLLSKTDPPTLQTTVLGVGAGAIASILYVLGELIGCPCPNFAVLAFSVIFGFLAGLTFHTVFKKLESVKALDTDILTHKRV